MNKGTEHESMPEHIHEDGPKPKVFKAGRVENQWHYKTMTMYGYRPITMLCEGLVRRYTYTHSQDGHKLLLVTGAHSDYWVDVVWKRSGSHLTLFEYLIERERARGTAPSIESVRGSDLRSDKQLTLDFGPDYII